MYALFQLVQDFVALKVQGWNTQYLVLTTNCADTDCRDAMFMDLFWKDMRALVMFVVFA